MLTRKKKLEARRLRNKESFQGSALEARIKEQFREVEKEKDRERFYKRSWLNSQVRVIDAEDELAMLVSIKMSQPTKGSVK